MRQNLNHEDPDHLLLYHNDGLVLLLLGSVGVVAIGAGRRTASAKRSASPRTRRSRQRTSTIAVSSIDADRSQRSVTVLRARAPVFAQTSMGRRPPSAFASTMARAARRRRPRPGRSCRGRRVLGRLQGRGGAAPVALVAAADVGEDVREIRPFAAAVELEMAPAGPLLRGRGDEELHLGRGADHGADVAPVEHGARPWLAKVRCDASSASRTA